jgi:hypothetical protein
MKKTFIFAAIACVALASCVKNEVVYDNGRDVADAPLVFNPLASPITKTVYGEIPAAYDVNEQFVAFAGWTEGVYDATAPTEFFPAAGITCQYVSGLYTWQPTTTYYWPKSGYLTFEAYSPAVASTYAGHTWAGGITFTDFAVPATIATQYDLMTSGREFNKKRGDYTITDASHGNAYDDENDATYTYNGVNLLFKHILSSIRFMIKTKADYSANAQFTLTGLTIDKAFSVGDYTEGVTVAAPAASYAATPAWSGQKTEADYTVVTGGSQAIVYNGGTALPLTNDPDIILLPQNLAHGTGLNDVTVTVNYTLAQNGGAALPQTAKITLKNLTTSSGATIVDEWELGKRYTYTIVFALDEIYFDPAVSDWTDVTMDEYTIQETDV